MNPFRALTGKQVVAALRGHGFQVIRIRGSHHYLRHPDGRATVVAVHAGETIGRGLMAKILRDAELSHDQLVGTS
jgi:predicted RNA binding protein YcfA (HicA-like mRNA interferase family)